MLGAYEENNQWIVDCSKQTKGPAIEFKIRNGGSLKLWPSVYVLKNTEVIFELVFKKYMLNFVVW